MTLADRHLVDAVFGTGAADVLDKLDHLADKLRERRERNEQQRQRACMEDDELQDGQA